MKYKRDGRVYKLHCPFTKGCVRFPDCTEGGNPRCKTRMRETIPSKIRGWLRGKCFCKWEPIIGKTWRSDCGYMPIRKQKIPICPKCHKIIRIKR
jgi:hypothetical protein